MVETTTIGALLEQLENEAENLDAVYFEENVVASQPELITVPKHVLLTRLADELSATRAANSYASIETQSTKNVPSIA